MTSIIPEFPRILLEGGVEEIDRKLAEQSAKLVPFRYDGPVGTVGKWTVKAFEVPEQSLDVLRSVRDGGRGMAPGKYHRLVRNDGTAEEPKKTIVMSDTDAEMIDFLEIIRPGWHGNILVGGMGMGLAIKTLLMFPKITGITIVERDQEVIDLIGPYVVRMCADARVPLAIVCDDIFKWKPAVYMFFDWAWFDIWDTISDSNVAEFQKLRRKYKKHVADRDRMTFWTEYECKQMSKGVDARNWY